MTDLLRNAFADRRTPLAVSNAGESEKWLRAPQPSAIVFIEGAEEPTLPSGAFALNAGDDQRLIVSECDAPATLMAHIDNPADGRHAITDVSHARCRMRLHGPNARAVLQCGMAIDLHETEFPVGTSTATAYRGIAVQLHAVATETFDLYVFRSYALTLREWLADAMRVVAGAPSPADTAAAET